MFTVKTLLLSDNVPWEMKSAGCAPSQARIIGCDPKLTMPAGGPLMAAAVPPTAVPVPEAVKVVPAPKL